MAIITLTSDMGIADHYLSTVKAALLSRAPEAQVVDVSHHVRHFDLQHAAYVLGSAWQHFPMGTVHIIGVKSELTANTPHVIVHYMSHYFIGADNGIFSLLFPESPEDVFEISYHHAEDWYFPMRGIFATCAAHLAKGGAPELVGRRVSEIRKIRVLAPSVDDLAIKGAAIHFDHFGNIHTNIHKSLFDLHQANRSFVITTRIRHMQVNKISNDFAEVTPGSLVAMWGSNGNLILGINQGSDAHGGSARSLLGAKLHDPVKIEFYGNQDS